MPTFYYNKRISPKVRSVLSQSCIFDISINVYQLNNKQDLRGDKASLPEASRPSVNVHPTLRDPVCPSGEPSEAAEICSPCCGVPVANLAPLLQFSYAAAVVGGASVVVVVVTRGKAAVRLTECAAVPAWKHPHVPLMAPSCLSIMYLNFQMLYMSLTKTSSTHSTRNNNWEASLQSGRLQTLRQFSKQTPVSGTRGQSR